MSLISSNNASPFSNTPEPSTFEIEVDRIEILIDGDSETEKSIATNKSVNRITTHQNNRLLTKNFKSNTTFNPVALLKLARKPNKSPKDNTS